MSEAPLETPQGTTSAATEVPAPALQVTRGYPTAEELAALTAVVLSASAAAEAPAEAARTRKDTIRTRVRNNRRMVSMPGAWRSGRF